MIQDVESMDRSTQGKKGGVRIRHKEEGEKGVTRRKKNMCGSPEAG